MFIGVLQKIKILESYQLILLFTEIIHSKYQLIKIKILVNKIEG